jgi:hypothetical protein
VLHEPAPFLEGDGVAAQVFVGSLGGVTGASRRRHGGVTGAPAYTPLVGAELTPRGDGPGRLPLETAYEHLYVPLAGWAEV